MKDDSTRLSVNAFQAVLDGDTIGLKLLNHD
jgi:hypothetical protein